MNLRATSLAVLLASTYACASSPATDGRLERRADAIQGGNDETGSTFAVAVVDNQETMCSGTLIAPNLVLTARHCVADDNGGDTVDCSHDQFLAARGPTFFRVSTAATGITFKTAEYNVSKVVVPTDASFCGNDVALLILASLVPASVAVPATPAIDPPLTDRATYGSSSIAIGYGTTSINGEDQGTRRRRDGIPFACIPGDKTLDCNLADFVMVANEFTGGDGLCDGDSGSGAYEPKSVAAGKPLVIGSLSRAGSEGNNCTDAIYERVDKMGPLLIATATDAATAGGYPLPTWAGGPPASDAGTGDASAPSDDAGGAPVADDAGSSATPSDDASSSSGCALGSRGAASSSSWLLVLFVAAALAKARSSRSS